MVETILGLIEEAVEVENDWRLASILDTDSQIYILCSVNIALTLVFIALSMCLNEEEANMPLVRKSLRIPAVLVCITAIVIDTVEFTNPVLFIIILIVLVSYWML